MCAKVLITLTSYVIGIDPGLLKSGLSTNCSSRLEFGIAKELKKIKTKQKIWTPHNLFITWCMMLANQREQWQTLWPRMNDPRRGGGRVEMDRNG